MSGGAIAGIVIGNLVVASIIVFFVIREHKRKEAQRRAAAAASANTNTGTTTAPDTTTVREETQRVCFYWSMQIDTFHQKPAHEPTHCHAWQHFAPYRLVASLLEMAKV